MSEKYIIDGTKLTAIADAVRSKTGETGSLTADQMAEKITNIQTGDTALTKLLLSGDGSIGTVDTTPLNITSYRSNAFSGIYGLYSIKDENVTSVGEYAFAKCYNLGGVNLPKVETVSKYAFSDCGSLKTLSLPLCSNVGSYAFAGAPFENVEIGADATSQIGVEPGAFNTTNTNPKRMITIGNGSMLGETLLQQYWVNFATECIIYNCSGFYGSENVAAFIFPKLYSANAPIYSGAVCKAPWYYFPAESVDQVKVATNWTTIADRIRPLEDLALNRIKITGGDPNTLETSATYKLIYNDGCYVRGDYKGATWSISGNATIKEQSDDACTIEYTNLSEGDTITLTATSKINSSISVTKTLTAKEIRASVAVETTQWVETGETPDEALTEVYKSDAGSYHVSNGASLAKVTFYGYTKLTLSVRSYAESNYDYVTVSDIDFSGTFTRDSASVLSTKGVQSSSEYTDYTFTTDGGKHFFYVLYSKDSSGDNNDDRGYFFVKAGE